MTPHELKAIVAGLIYPHLMTYPPNSKSRILGAARLAEEIIEATGPVSAIAETPREHLDGTPSRSTD